MVYTNVPSKSFPTDPTLRKMRRNKKKNFVGTLPTKEEQKKDQSAKMSLSSGVIRKHDATNGNASKTFEYRNVLVGSRLQEFVEFARIRGMLAPFFSF